MDSTTLMINQTNLLTLRAASVRLESTLAAYRLRFELELQFLTTDPSISEIRLPGEVRVAQAQNSASPQLIGPLRLDRFGTVLPPSKPGARPTEYAEADLPRAGLEALETIREGDGLTFQLQFQPLVITQSRPVPLAHAQVEIEVNQSRWLALLEQARYRQTLLFELPVPDPHLHPDLEAAVRHLEGAQLHFLRGHYRDAVARCRDSLDALTDSLGDKQLLEQLVAKDLPDLPKADRLRLLRRSLFRLSNLAHHGDPLATSTKWTREDAHAVIAITASILLVSWDDSSSG